MSTSNCLPNLPLPSEFLISILNFTVTKHNFWISVFQTSSFSSSSYLSKWRHHLLWKQKTSNPLPTFNAVPETHICSGCCDVPSRGDKGMYAHSCWVCWQLTALCPLWKLPSPGKSYLTQGHPPFLGARSHTETDVWGLTPNTGLLWKAIPASVSFPPPPQGISWGFTETASQPSFSFCPACFLPFPLLPCHGCWPQVP